MFCMKHEILQVSLNVNQARVDRGVRIGQPPSVENSTVFKQHNSNLNAISYPVAIIFVYLLIESWQETKDSLKNEYFYCDFVIKCENSLLEHCIVCKQSGGKDLIKDVHFYVQSESQNHMEIVQSYLNRVLQCNICQETFEYTTLFEMHKMFSHQGKG